MHCILQLFTKNQPTYLDIENIMSPFYEDNFYEKYYDPSTDEYMDIPSEDYPMFDWDYYTVIEQVSFDGITKPDIGNCYTMIDKQGRPHSRTRWNGKEHEDLTKDFEYWARRIERESRAGDWMTTIDYHY